MGSVGAGRSRLAPTAVVIATLTSCSAAAPAEAPNEPRIGTPLAVTSLTEVPDRPIDAFLPTASQLAAIEQATTARVNQCLRRHQVSQQVTDTPDLQSFIAALLSDRRTRSDLYGFFDTNAEGRGYAHTGITATGYQAHVPAETPSATLTLCATEADRANHGLALTMEDSRLPSGGPMVPRGDSRFRAVAHAWSRCMADAGFDYMQPLDALTDPRWRVEGANPSAAQIATARADIACKQRTNLVGIAVALLTVYDNAYIARERAALHALSYRPAP